jgi:proline dehydrogenase
MIPGFVRELCYKCWDNTFCPLHLFIILCCFMNPPPVISFDNTENAFAPKTDKELKKARFLFASMGYESLVKLGTKITPWAIKAGLPVKGLIRNTIFKQFVGGESLEETATVARRLGDYNVQVILDYGVEGGDHGEEGLDHACDEFIRVIKYAATQPNIPFMSVKITGIARFGLLEKLDKSVEENAGSLMKRYVRATEALTEAEKAEWHRVHERMHRICNTAASKKIGVLIDAEETWIQDPVDVLTILMMEQFNRDRVVVYNTIQLYRHDRLQFLKNSYEAANDRGFILGAKLVRGAYMEKERKRAAELNYASPIQPDKDACDRDYNLALEFCVEHLDRIALVVASHNEYSNLYTTQLMAKHHLDYKHPHIHFSQLYGMSDNITFNLAKAGWPVSKYLPFGPIKEVIPYLMRRAQENSSVAGQTGRELMLIEKEIKRRGL